MSIVCSNRSFGKLIENQFAIAWNFAVDKRNFFILNDDFGTIIENDIAKNLQIKAKHLSIGAESQVAVDSEVPAVNIGIFSNHTTAPKYLILFFGQKFLDDNVFFEHRAAALNVLFHRRKLLSTVGRSLPIGKTKDEPLLYTPNELYNIIIPYLHKLSKCQALSKVLYVKIF